MEKRTTHAATARKYDSNPFTLAFNALGRLFSHNATWAVVLIIFSAVGFFFQGIGNLASLTSGDSSTSSSYPSTASTTGGPDVAVIIAIVIVVFVFLVVAILVGTAINVFIQGMFSQVALESEEERSADFSQVFNHTAKRFWVLFSAQLLAVLKIIGWTCLLIIPGIVAAMRYALLPYLIMNEPVTSAGEAHTRIKTLTKRRLWEVYGVTTVAALVPIIGPVLGLAGKAALYNQIKYSTDNNIEKPKIHFLNYLGLLIIAALLLLILFIIGVVLLVHFANKV